MTKSYEVQFGEVYDLVFKHNDGSGGESMIQCFLLDGEWYGNYWWEASDVWYPMGDGLPYEVVKKSCYNLEYLFVNGKVVVVQHLNLDGSPKQYPDDEDL